MKWPRVRIFDLMGLVVLAAINCVPFRLLNNQDLPYSVRFTACWLVPMLSILAMLMLSMTREIRRTGQCRPFHAGFFVSCLIGMVGAANLTGWEDMTFDYFELVATGFNRVFAFAKPMNPSSTVSKLDMVIEYVALTLSLVLPQLFVATIGGILAKVTGLTISRSRKSDPTPEVSVLVA